MNQQIQDTTLDSDRIISDFNAVRSRGPGQRSYRKLAICVVITTILSFTILTISFISIRKRYQTGSIINTSGTDASLGLYVTKNPSIMGTSMVSTSPSFYSSFVPSSNPTSKFSSNPSSQPSKFPSVIPSEYPSVYPSEYPTSIPTSLFSTSPSTQHSSPPSGHPTSIPTSLFSTSPSTQHSSPPSRHPTSIPTSLFSTSPSTQHSSPPSRHPTNMPSPNPTELSSTSPSIQPSIVGSNFPSEYPTGIPSPNPTSSPTTTHSVLPSLFHSSTPSEYPSLFPSSNPTALSSTSPSVQPSLFHSHSPSNSPTVTPTQSPTFAPTISPTAYPTGHNMPPEKISFLVMGDVPYKTEAFSLVAKHIDGIKEYSENDMTVAPDFLIHVGDLTRASNSDCKNEWYSNVANILRKSSIPVFVTPGDNDYLDCPDPDEALKRWRTHFEYFDRRHWNHNLNVQYQQNRPENVAFFHKGVLFVMVHIIAPAKDDNDCDYDYDYYCDEDEDKDNDEEEFEQRHEDNAKWVRRQIRKHEKHGYMRSVVIFGHAKPRSIHDDFFDPIKDLARKYSEIPFTYIHVNDCWLCFYQLGDGHSYQEKSFNSDTMTRVQVEEGKNEGPLLCTVDHPNSQTTIDFRRAKKE